MPRFSWCIVTYGLLLIAADIVDRVGSLNLSLGNTTFIACWAAGILIVAAGMASAQGRRSLRLTGLYIGTLFPLGLAGIFGWQAIKLWQGRTGPGNWGPTSSIALLALASIFLVLLIAHFRPHDDIASRGYAVPLPPPRKNPLSPVETKPVRSQAS